MTNNGAVNPLYTLELDCRWLFRILRRRSPQLTIANFVLFVLSLYPTPAVAHALEHGFRRQPCAPICSASAPGAFVAFQNDQMIDTITTSIAIGFQQGLQISTN